MHPPHVEAIHPLVNVAAKTHVVLTACDPAGGRPGGRRSRSRWTLTRALLVSLSGHLSAFALLTHWVLLVPERSDEPFGVFSVGIGWGATSSPGMSPPEGASPLTLGEDSADEPTVRAMNDGPELVEAVAVEGFVEELAAGDPWVAASPELGLSPGLGLWMRKAGSSGAADTTAIERADTTGADAGGIAATGGPRSPHGGTAPLPLAGNSPPAYPESARRTGQEGLVVVAVLVGRDGWVRSVSVDRSSGHAALDQAALQAVAGWRFAAAVDEDEPIERAINVPIVFRLRSART